MVLLELLCARENARNCLYAQLRDNHVLYRHELDNGFLHFGNGREVRSCVWLLACRLFHRTDVPDPKLAQHDRALDSERL